MRFPSLIRGTACGALLLLLPGCAGGLGNLGTLADILGGGGMGGGAQQGQVTAEIQQVDAQRQLIHIRTQQGQTGSVSFDQRTQVVYQQQQYPVTALESGDVVTMQLQQDAQGNVYASRIDVQQSVQERTGRTSNPSGQVQQLTGQVGQIDHTRGVFELRTQVSGTVVVSLPYNAPQASRDYFGRLRTGDTVRLEATPIGNGRVELYRFL